MICARSTSQPMIVGIVTQWKIAAGVDVDIEDAISWKRRLPSFVIH